jgi:N-acetylmuramoyl-L-alanine amidase
VARERELLRAGPHRLAGRKIFVAATPELAVLGEQLARGFSEAGVIVVTDTSGNQDSLLADAANRFGADLFVSVRLGVEPGWRCAHFATGRFRSEAGRAVAVAIREEISPILAAGGEVAGRAYASLRETRMPAVVCELAQEGAVESMRAVVTAIGEVAKAILRGVRIGVEQPQLDEL